MEKITLSEFATERAIRNALSKAIRGSAKSREMIASELSVATKTPITARSLDNYTAESRAGYRLPAAWVIPFCNIVGNDSLLRAVIGPQLMRILSLGEQQLRVHQETATLLKELPQDEAKSRR